MAKLRSALARGGSRALSGLSEGITQLQQQRLEEARLEAQRQFQLQLAEKAFQRQQLLQDDSQAFQLQLRDAERQAQLAEEQRKGKLQLGVDANVPGVDPAQIAARAQGLGMGDEFFPGTGSRINMPDDPRLSPEFRGKSLTTFAMPIRPSGAERPPIEALLQQAMSSQRTGLKQAFDEKQEEFEAQPFVDESGTEVIQGPSGELRPTERNVEQEGTRQARITDIGTPAAGRRAFSVSRNQAAGDPNILPILGPDGATNAMARVGPTGPPDIFAAAPLTAAQANGQNDQRADAIGTQLSRFKELSAHVNQFDGFEQRLHGAVQWWKSKTGQDLKAEEYGRILRPLGVSLAVYTQGSRPTDTDAAIMTESLGGFTTSKTVAQNLIKMAEAAVNRAKAANPGLDLDNMTIEEIEAAKAKGLFRTTMSAADLAALLASSGGRLPDEVNTTISLEDLRRQAGAR